MIESNEKSEKGLLTALYRYDKSLGAIYFGRNKILDFFTIAPMIHISYKFMPESLKLYTLLESPKFSMIY